MKKIFSTYIAAIALLSITFMACTDDDPITVTLQLPKAEFSKEITDMKVVFTNKSQNALSYFWTFGDGETSTDQNPTHTYAKDGTYIAELTITGKDGKTDSIDEDIVIGKGGPTPGVEVEITIDGTFDDWKAVEEGNLVASTLDEEASGLLRLKEVKFCANKTYIYMYMKMDKEDANAMDIYMNTDGKKDTGYNGWMWKDLAANYYMQATFADKYDMALRKYDESKGGSWGWLSPNVVEAGQGLIEVSNMVTVGGNIVEFEARINRSMIPDLRKEVRVAIGHSGLKGDLWSTSGGLPTVTAAGDKNEPLVIKLP